MGLYDWADAIKMFMNVNPKLYLFLCFFSNVDELTQCQGVLFLALVGMLLIISS
jgi:hypothetical protein